MQKSEQYIGLFEGYLTLKNYGSRTVKFYVRSIKTYFEYVRKHQCEEKTVEDYSREYLLSLHHRGYSWSTVNMHYSALVILHRHVLRKKWSYEMIPRPKLGQKLPVILSKQEVEMMVNGLRNIKHQIIILSLYATGCRIGELINLKIAEIDMEGKMLRINEGKGGRDRIIHVSGKYIDLLYVYLKKYKPHEYLIEGKGSTTKYPKQYSRSSVTNVLRKTAMRVGIKKVVTAHTIRHSYATHNLNIGTNLEYLRRQLGHSTLKTTSIYLHLCQYQNQQLYHPLEHLRLAIFGQHR